MVRRFLVVATALATIGFAGCWSLGVLPMSSVLAAYSRIASDSGVAVERGLAYGPNARHRLDVYRPASGGDAGPIVLFIYGGGWKSGERSMYGFVGSALAARGITTVIADYRLYPETPFPGFVEDGALAYAWVARSLAMPRGRPIVLAGHSAGAHTAALLALDRGYLDRLDASLPRPVALIGLSGPYAFDPTTWPSTQDVFAPAANAPDTARPVTFASNEAPPTLLMHGLDDETVRLFNMRELAAALTKAGVPVEALELKGLGHFGVVQAMARGFRWRAPVLERMVAFIEKYARETTVRAHSAGAR